jgi:inactivated superfamily I helicase
MKNLTLRTTEDVDRFIRIVRDAQRPLTALCEPYKDTRRNIANSKMWAMLADVSEQVVYHGQKYTADDWKDILTASLAGELRMAPTTDGQRIVILGLRTSQMTIAKMSEFTEFMYAFGAEKEVAWADPTDIINTEV